VSFISSLAAGVLKKHRKELYQRNLELSEKTVSLEKAEAELKKTQVYLEKQVQERTHRLREANDQLKADIAKRERIEAALLKSERKYRLHFESVSEVIFSLDRDFKVLSVSPSVEKLLGYKSEEIIGKDFQDLNILVPDYIEKAYNDLMRVFSGETIPSSIYEFIAKDGAKKIGEVSGTPVYHDGEVVSLVSVARDITEKKYFEDQLRQAQKMEALGTMAGGIAHNFRNILTVILMNCQILQGKYKEASELKASTDTMISYVNRGVKLIDQLMEFSRQEPKKDFSPLNLFEVLKETHQLCKETFDKKISIRLSGPEFIPMKGNYSELFQVFMNLFANASDAMPNGGILNIDSSVDENQACIVISDKGEGMSKDAVEKCFEPFFTTKSFKKGTGLGLSTAYGTIKKHGGKITVQSELDKGTTFKVYLPLSFYDEEIEQKALNFTKPTLAKKILIVDDEIEICKLIKELLEKLGYMVEYVDSGKAAIEKYQSWKPDAVLLDRNMPGMDGMTCAERIVNYDSGAKILIISGYDANGPTGIAEHQKELIKGYLTKPIHIIELNAQLEDIFIK
jgi:PAS domain S-box-containing protein